jgi:hypothetical protein
MIRRSRRPAITDARSLGILLVGSAVAFGGSILLIAAGEEPYHIDELRQVRSYGRPLADVVSLSLGQQQPPLDPLVNSAVQSLIGLGDIRQRSVSVLLGTATLWLLGWLVLRTLGPVPAFASVVSLLASPLFVSVTAYARPYAMPLFLMLTFIAASVQWLARPRLFYGVTIAVAALLLPLSRTTEPPLFLAAAIASLLLFERDEGSWRPRRRAWLPVGAASVAILLVAVPVVLRLRQEVSSFTSAEAGFSARLVRLVTDLPETLAEVVAGWQALILGLIVLAAVPTVRRRLLPTWWFWPLAMLPVAFAVLFFQQANTSQPYFARYAFTFLIPIAVLVGAATSASLEAWQTSRRFPAGLAAVSLATFVLINFANLQGNLATETSADFKQAAIAVKNATPPGSLVLFDSVRPLGDYRTPFAGSPRYIDPRWKIPLTTTLASMPQLVPPSAPVYVLLLGAKADVPGWIGAPVGRQFWLYQPVEPVRGAEGTAITAAAFGRALSREGDTRGTSFMLASAAVLRDAGENNRARAIINEAVSRTDETELDALRRALGQAGLGDLLPN